MGATVPRGTRPGVDVAEREDLDPAGCIAHVRGTPDTLEGMTGMRNLMARPARGWVPDPAVQLPRAEGARPGARTASIMILAARSTRPEVRTPQDSLPG